MTTTDDSPARRIRVRHEPIPGHRPWRAVIVESGTAHAEPRDIPVGRFDDQPEALRTAVSALRFVTAGITWQPVGMDPIAATDGLDELLEAGLR